MENFVTSKVALALLNVRPQTLYAYVSRGLIRRYHLPGTTKNRYDLRDIEAIIARKLAHRGHVASAADAMNWGSPILTTKVTRITPAGPEYRGRNYRELIAYPGSFESVAELLWTGILLDEQIVWHYDPLPDACALIVNNFVETQQGATILRVLSAATLALGESSADDLRLENTAQAARRLLFAFAGAIGTLGPQREFKISEPGTSMAQCVLQALGSEPDPDKEEAINALMICAADHELSPPTFAARVCASSHAGLHACVLAAIGAHSGYRLGRGCDRVEDLLDSFSDEADMRGKVLEQLRRSQQMPGFNLMLYPHGDPRAVTLLNVAASFQGVSRARITEAAIELIKAESGQLPNIEVALVAVTQALGLPRRSAGALWALARTAGWVAHVIEQRLSGDEIRPRAKFT